MGSNGGDHGEGGENRRIADSLMAAIAACSFGSRRIMKWRWMFSATMIESSDHDAGHEDERESVTRFSVYPRR